jgi:serine/threonine protein phosphatase PrpC
MRKDNSEIVTSFLSEAGTSISNKDYFAYVELDDVACWVLADGLDTDEETQSAELAVKSILGNFLEKPTLSRRRVKKYIQEAHKLLQAESTRVRLKCGLLVVVSDYSSVIYATAGHTRMYHFRGGRINLRSRDQSLAQAMTESRELTEEEIDTHEERHNLLYYLGKPDDFKPYISPKLTLADGDTMVLCTPGLWEGVKTSEMTDAVRETKEASELVDTLEDILLSKQNPQVPNYTAAVIQARKVYKAAPKTNRNHWKMVRNVAMILVPLLLFGGGVYYYKARAVAAQAEAAASIFEHEKNGDVFARDGSYDKALNEYSLARNAAMKVKDKLHAELIERKQRISQLVVDGDAAFKGGDYQKAATAYDKALKEAIDKKDFNMKEVEENHVKAKTFLEILAMVKEGDLKADNQDFAGAKDLYQKAKRTAVLSSFTSGEKDIQTKIDSVDSKMADIKKGERQKDGDELEKKGDEQFAAEEYQLSIDSYAAAQVIYQEINMLEKVLSMERKIGKSQEILNAKKKETEEAKPEA